VQCAEALRIQRLRDRVDQPRNTEGAARRLEGRGNRVSSQVELQFIARGARSDRQLEPGIPQQQVRQ
jgi:hypothetical protein